MASCGTGACHRATKETGGSGARSTWLGGIACGCLGAEGGSSKRDEQVRSLKERDFILFPIGAQLDSCRHTGDRQVLWHLSRNTSAKAIVRAAQVKARYCYRTFRSVPATSKLLIGAYLFIGTYADRFCQLFTCTPTGLMSSSAKMTPMAVSIVATPRTCSTAPICRSRFSAFSIACWCSFNVVISTPSLW